MSLAVVGEVIAGRYQLEELVGVGGMSNVYRAHDRLLERMVALKLLHDRYSNDDEYVERFRREARSAARLSHPGIVTVIDRGEQDGHQFIVFEHVPGETLKQLVDREGPLPVDLAIELALQIGRALSFAHERGLIHRDVKPQNVLLNGDGRAKVTDFGIARAVDVDATTTGSVVGTSHYMAPEQAKGEKADGQSDVYGLGAVLYELLSGEVPFPGDNFVTVAMRHVNDPLPSLLEKRPELPLRLVAAVERALEKDPARRFPTMGAFVDELEACRQQLLSGDNDQATQIIRGRIADDQTAIRRPAAPPRRRRSPWPLILILAGLALAAIAVGLFFFGDVTNTGKTGGNTGPVDLNAVAAYDPYVGDGEHDDMVKNATDGNPTTYWETESYENLHALKPGVGIVFDAGHPVSPKEIVVTASGTDLKARIQTGSSRTDVNRLASPTLPVNGTTTFEVVQGVPARYFALWITQVIGRALVYEVKAR
jgi:eukaryotic-like serine/threonine-protein kinase